MVRPAARRHPLVVAIIGIVVGTIIEFVVVPHLEDRYQRETGGLAYSGPIDVGSPNSTFLRQLFVFSNRPASGALDGATARIDFKFRSEVPTENLRAVAWPSKVASQVTLTPMGQNAERRGRSKTIRCNVTIGHGNNTKILAGDSFFVIVDLRGLAEQEFGGTDASFRAGTFDAVRVDPADVRIGAMLEHVPWHLSVVKTIFWLVVVLTSAAVAHSLGVSAGAKVLRGRLRTVGKSLNRIEVSCRLGLSALIRKGLLEQDADAFDSSKIDALLVQADKMLPPLPGDASPEELAE